MTVSKNHCRRSVLVRRGHGLLAAVAAALLHVACAAQAEPSEAIGAAGHRVVTVAEGLEHPWGMAFLPNGEGILVTERTGRLRIIRDGVPDSRPIEGVPAVRAEGESGLLDVALHPSFAENRLVYLSFARPGPNGSTTAVVRGRLTGHTLSDVEDVFVAAAWGRAAVNHGGRLAFDPNGYLYLTVGDRREEARAQALSDHAGTIVRLSADGQIPPDNPFVATRGVLPEIFSYGHRNAIGLYIDPTGEVWASENGAAGGDEVNLIRPGTNYGWPAVSFGNHYDGRPIPDHREGDGFGAPAIYWTPGVSPSGLVRYDGEAFPQWRGDFFGGSLQARHLSRLRRHGDTLVEEERLLTGLSYRIRDVAVGPDGYLYLLVDAADAPLLRLEPVHTE